MLASKAGAYKSEGTYVGSTLGKLLGFPTNIIGKAGKAWKVQTLQLIKSICKLHP
jgi:hypothetical protein